MNYLSIALAVLFILERSFFRSYLEALSSHGTLIFEGILVAIYLATEFEKIKFKFKWSYAWAFGAALCFIAGAGIFFTARAMEIAIPFPFGGVWFALLLVLIGPVLEELLYRALLWDVSRSLFHKSFVTLAITALLFSADHFSAYFGVDPVFRAFILFQTLYTLIFGLVLGYARLKQNSVLSPMILHIVFNLGFLCAAQALSVEGAVSNEPSKEEAAVSGDQAIPQELGEWTEFNEALGQIRESMPAPSLTPNSPEKTGPRILIADMPVANLSLFPRDKGLKIFVPQDMGVGPGGSSGELPRGCENDLARIEEFFAALLASRAPPFELDDATVRKLEETLWRTHGYHVLGLVQAGLRKTEIILQPMHAPPSILEGIKDHKQYAQNVIMPEMVALYKSIRDHKPDLVLVVSTESAEEIERDLLTGGYAANDARLASEELMGAIIGAWTTLISSFPNTRFIVPVGNGGVDSIGDRLESRMLRRGPIPAVLPFGNMIRVASYEKRKDSCLSSFSNFGVEAADLAAKGREVQSWAPCAGRNNVKLTGTSQAAAKVTNFFAASLENGVSIEDTLKHFQKEDCLEDRVSTASRLPEP